MYLLQWSNPSVDLNKATAIQVPVGGVVSNKASIRFTGKGSANYGAVQQENLMRMMEHFASPTAPLYPTVGEIWYNTGTSLLQLCVSSSPIVWKSVQGIQVTEVGVAAPTPANLGDFWYQKTGASSGILYVYTGIGRFPTINNTIGGWEQIYPTVTNVGGREEYESILALLNILSGPYQAGGSGAIGRSITYLTNLSALDASLRTAFNAKPDINVLAPTSSDQSELLIDVTSQDWDALLAACRYAVFRLELPQSYFNDISPIPFVTDGRPAHSFLLGLNTADGRYPSLERRSNRKFGIATLVKNFAETANVMNAAVANRFSLKGVNGASGSNTAFDPTVVQRHQAAFAGGVAGASSIATSLTFRFASEQSMFSFLNSGGIIQVSMAMNNPQTNGDNKVAQLFSARGFYRATADRLRVFGTSQPYTLAQAPGTFGIGNAGPGGYLLGTMSLDGTTNYTVTAYRDTTSFRLVTVVTTTEAMNGTMSISFEVISDTEQYNDGTGAKQVYDTPAVYAPGDAGGNSVLVFQY